MAQLNREQLQFCFDELLGELGWGDEIAETGVDPLNWARDEIKDLHKQIKRLRKSLELRNAAEQPLAPDVLARCAKCNALIETTVHCDNCGTFEPTRR